MDSPNGEEASPVVVEVSDEVVDGFLSEVKKAAEQEGFSAPVQTEFNQLDAFYAWLDTKQGEEPRVLNVLNKVHDGVSACLEGLEYGVENLAAAANALSEKMDNFAKNKFVASLSSLATNTVKGLEQLDEALGKSSLKSDEKVAVARQCIQSGVVAIKAAQQAVPTVYETAKQAVRQAAKGLLYARQAVQVTLKVVHNEKVLQFLRKKAKDVQTGTAPEKTTNREEQATTMPAEIEAQVSDTEAKELVQQLETNKEAVLDGMRQQIEAVLQWAQARMETHPKARARLAKIHAGLIEGLQVMDRGMDQLSQAAINVARGMEAFEKSKTAEYIANGVDYTIKGLEITNKILAWVPLPVFVQAQAAIGLTIIGLKVAQTVAPVAWEAAKQGLQLVAKSLVFGRRVLQRAVQALQSEQVLAVVRKKAEEVDTEVDVEKATEKATDKETGKEKTVLKQKQLRP